MCVITIELVLVRATDIERVEVNMNGTSDFDDEIRDEEKPTTEEKLRLTLALLDDEDRPATAVRTTDAECN